MIFPAGTVIDGKYEIDASIGAGGFGTVYRATHRQLGRPVAIKFINIHSLTAADTLPRFEREAKAVSQLRHKNIVAFYGYGIWKDSPYMVLELVIGTSLQQLLASGKPLPLSKSLDLTIQILNGLACAHGHGIIHRDLKPSNILISSDKHSRDTVKLIDFGLVKLAPGGAIEDQKLTETGVAIGSCLYMSPEQCVGSPIDHRSDLYSVGCILFHALTGRLPFEADNNIAVMFRHMNEAVPRLAEVDPQLAGQAELQEFLDRAMNKDPEARFESASSMLSSLKDLQKMLSLTSTQEIRTPSSIQQFFSKSPNITPLQVVSVTAVLSCSFLTALLLYPPNSVLSSFNRLFGPTDADTPDDNSSKSWLALRSSIQELSKGNRVAARKKVTEALKAYDEDHGLSWKSLSQAYFCRANIRTLDSDFKEAQKDINHALSIRRRHLTASDDPEEIPYKIAYARSLMGDRRYVPALDCLQELKPLCARRPTAIRNELSMELGRALTYCKQPRHAIAEFDTALERNSGKPLRAALLASKGYALQQEGAVMKAAECYRLAIKESPLGLDRICWFYLAQCAWQSGDFASAQASLEKYRAVMGNELTSADRIRIDDMHCYLAIARKDKAGLGKAIETLKQDIRRDPEIVTGPDIKHLLGQLIELMRAERHDAQADDLYSHLSDIVSVDDGGKTP